MSTGFSFPFIAGAALLGLLGLILVVVILARDKD